MNSLVCWFVLIFPLIFGHSDFGEGYTVYSISPGSPIRIFAYRPGVIALVYQNESQGIVVQLQRVDTFERSSPFTVKETAHSHNYRIEACFERGGHAYLLAYDTILKETLIIKGQDETFIPLRNYDLLRYDYLEDQVYILRNGTMLRYPFDDVTRYDDMGEIQAPPLEKHQLEQSFTDLQVIGGQQLAIFDQAVNRQLSNGSWAHVMPTKADAFWFQLLPAERAEPSSAFGQLTSNTILFVVEICVLLFAAYCLNFKLKLRPQSGSFELSRGDIHHP